MFVGRFVVLGVFSLAAAQSHAQVVQLVSVDSAGAQGSQYSSGAALSSDGRFVLFSSHAPNLVASDTNAGISDVFLRDRALGTTELVGVSSSGAQATDDAFAGDVSDDGRYVAFIANALAPSDTDFPPDVYWRDRASGVTQVLTSSGPFSQSFYGVSISDDGQRVAYYSYDWNGNHTLAVVVEPATGASWQWSGSSPGLPAPSSGYSPPVLSGSGRRVFFAYDYDNGYGWGYDQVVCSDLQTGAQTTWLRDQSATPRATSRDGRWLAYTIYPRVAVLDTRNGTIEEVPVIAGAQPDAYTSEIALSDDGRYLAFTSAASNFVAGDTNGKSDVFVRDLRSHVTVRAVLGVGGAQLDGDCYALDLAGDGSVVAFDSAATNVLSGDANGASDVFASTLCFAHHVDADGDGYGSATPPLSVCLPATGYSLNALDCDDANPSRHPGAPDLLDGFDEDCDGTTDEDLAGASYCTAGTAISQCVAQFTGAGTPSAATAGYSFSAQSVPGQRSGLVLYGLGAAVSPWGTNGTSYTCVAAPRQRTVAVSSGGTLYQCDGSFSFDPLAYASAHPGALGGALQPGETRYYQAWFRDPSAPGGSSLSGGWVVRFGP